MKSEADTKEFFKNASISTNPKMDEAILNRLHMVREKTIDTKPALKKPNIWRMIMRSRITKLAAAAVVILAVIAGLYDFHFISPAYGITDVPELLQNVKTLHFKGFSTLYSENEEPVSYPVECWIDFENRCYRYAKPFWKVSPDGYTFGISENILDDEYQMFMNHTNKEAGFIKNTPLRQRLFINYQYYKNDRFLKQFTTESDQLDKFKVVVQEEIDDEIFDVWENKADYGRITKFWLSPRTGKMGRYYVRYQQQIEIEDGFLPNGVWVEYIINTIECDIKLPADIFNMIPPVGYTIKNNKDNAPMPELLAGGSIKIGTFNLKIHIVCTLSEGSVIVGWSVLDNTSSEGNLFQNLEYGGALPKTGVELYALHPIYDKRQIQQMDKTTTYLGRHLTYSQVGNTYCEWSIYVPDSGPLKNDFKLYHTMFRGNPEDGNLSTHSIVDSHCIISSEEDFKVYVLGAMAELSNDGKTPEGITYEGVLELAQEIRESLTE